MGSYPCNGICYKYGRIKNQNMINKKYCTPCERNIQWEGLRCPCCSAVLRLRTNSPKYAKKEAAEKSERLGY